MSNALIAMIAWLEAEISGQDFSQENSKDQMPHEVYLEMRSSYSRYESSSSNRNRNPKTTKDTGASVLELRAKEEKLLPSERTLEKRTRT